MTSSVAVPEPEALSIGTDGTMQGRTRSYHKRLRDMRNIYRDSAARQCRRRPVCHAVCYAADVGQNYGLIADVGAAWRNS
ncbi:MAG: hypothetical protein ACJ72M_17065 [Propionibacteriaceae bacterium]